MYKSNLNIGVFAISCRAEQLGNFDYYSMTGETNTLTFTGACYNFEMGECNKIEFTNSLFITYIISICV